MKSFLITSISILLFCNSLYSKSIDSFKIADYKYRVAKYKALNVEADLKNKTNNSFFNNSTFNQYSGNLNAKFNALWFKSTANYIGTTTININALPSFSTSKNTINANSFYKKKSQSLISNNSISTYNKFYKFNNFILLSNISSIDYKTNFASDKQNYLGSYSTQLNNNSIQVNENLEIGVGKGRLELVTDAATALFILKDLEKTESKKNIDSDKISLLTRAITQLNTTRKFDYRMRKIYILKQLDSVLNSLQLTNQSSIDNFTILNDNLFYANILQRYSGTIKGISLMNQLSYFNSSFHSNHSLYNLNIDTILKNKYANANIGLKFYMESQKAINLKWQREISVGVIFYANNIYNKQINNLTVYNAIDNKDYAATNLYFTYEKSFIPNTRTNITGYVGLNSTIQKNTKSNFKYHQNTGLGLTVNYWIAPRLQTKLNAEIFHFLSFDKYKNIQSSMTTNLNCGLLYYFY